MKLLTFAAATMLAAGTASAEVKVTVHDGLVSIVATDATARQIIAEWARVGQARVINGERVPGGPMTIELTNVPEAQALDTLLRSAAGYLAAPRAVFASNLSRFDRVVVMPTTSAPRPTPTTGAPGAFQQPQFGQPQFGQPQGQPPIEDDQDDRPIPPNPALPNPRGPVFNAFPQPQVINPQTGAPVTVVPQPQGNVPVVGGVPLQQGQPVQQPAYPAAPTAPFGGVSVPGMVAPAPQQPGQIGVPPQPGQVRRPGGIQ